MASTINSGTEYRVHRAIADAGDLGLSVSQLVIRTRLSQNTLRLITRKLKADRKIAIEKDSTRQGMPNIYVSLAEPVEPPNARGRLAQIIEILEPFSQYPKSWDKAYKGEIINAIQTAIKLAISEQ